MDPLQPGIRIVMIAFLELTRFLLTLLTPEWIGRRWRW